MNNAHETTIEHRFLTYLNLSKITLMI